MSSKLKKLQQYKAAASSSSAAVAQSSSSSSLSSLEELFISKFTEKYNLTERDISRAFKRFDKDGSGDLNVNELVGAIHLFLNGVSIDKVKQLVNHYDVDGDGLINITEFTQFLLSRSGPNKDEWLTVDNLIAKGNNNSNDDNNNNMNDNIFDCASEISKLTYNDTTSNTIEIKAKTFLQNLKGMLLKRAMEMRLERKVPLEDRLSNHLNPLAESLARQMIAKAFQPYCRKGTRVDFTSFCRVLHKFNGPGQAPPKEEVYKFLYGMCDGGTLDGQLADPDILIDIVFDKGGHVINKYGFIQEVKPILSSGRPETGTGPIVKKPGDMPIKLSDVPLSFVTKHCRNAIASPSNFDVRMIEKSSQRPHFAGEVDHVYGLNIDLYSGAAIHSLSCSHDPGHKDLVVYTSAALGIVHDLAGNHQIHFKGHTDNITCICICSDGSLVATGQLGKPSYVCIWALDSFMHPTEEDIPGIRNNDERVPGLLAVIGKGFFQRGVCAIGFNQDGRFLAGIGCDDKHEIGIWKVTTGELLTSMSCTNGVPPQIKDLCWCPALQSTGYISQDHDSSKNELMCTVGERHIKFWSFRPAGKGNYNASLVGKLFRMGKSGFDSPKLASCVAFVPSNSDRYDVVTGADSGHIHRWKEGVCVGGVLAIPGGVLTLKANGSLLFCGGAKGIVKMINADDLSILQVFCVLPTTDSVNDRPPTSARSRPGTPSNVPVAGAVSKQSTSNVAKKLIKQPKQYKGPLIGDAKEEQIPEGVKGSANVTSISLEYSGPNVTSIIATTGFGRLVRINISSDSTNTILYYHYGSLYGLAIDKSTGSFFASGGDDKWLNVWDSKRKSLVCRARTRAPIKCIDFNVVGDSIAVGHASGIIVIYALLKDRHGTVGGAFERLEGTLQYKLQELTKRKDCQEDISDIKFCPNGKMLAVGSHDNYIDLYQYKLIESSVENGFSLDRQLGCELRYLKRLKGHNSFITHLDWSADNRLLQSTCGAYELLYWDVLSGRQLLNSQDAVEADTAWNTNTCVLGFGVMGIWPPGSDGTDVNGVDVSKRNGIVVTGDDYGHVNVFNYPCIVKDAPRMVLKGHSSHVLNVKIIPTQAHTNVHVLTVGGDSSLIQWILPATSNY